MLWSIQILWQNNRNSHALISIPNDVFAQKKTNKYTKCLDIWNWLRSKEMQIASAEWTNERSFKPHFDRLFCTFK